MEQRVQVSQHLLDLQIKIRIVARGRHRESFVSRFFWGRAPGVWEMRISSSISSRR